jgi:hypothetical protein
MLRGFLIVLLVLTLAAPALPAEPASDGGTINIMKPEPAAPAKKKSTKTHKARGSSNPVYPAPLPKPQAPLAVPRQKEVTPHRPQVPPPLYVPQTGRLLPNLPPATGSGPHGAESFQDRAARCVHQSGVYGPNATGDPGSYIRSCINQ